MTKLLNVLSFDIGIKNMAFCLLNVEETINMREWCIIDISKNRETIIDDVKVCTCKRKKNDCKIKAKYVKNGMFYCEKHAKETIEYIIPEKRFQLSCLKKKKLADLMEIIREFSIHYDSNTKMNKNQIVNLIESFFNVKCFEKITDSAIIKTQDIDLITLGRNMTKILNMIPQLDDVTHVILENQISTLASRMKTIQGMLAQYFIMRFGDSINIEFVSSINKLKGFPKRDDITLTNNYKNNKADAIFYTRKILSKNLALNLVNTTNIEWADSLKLKKKDDLCDCFLQGIWYLQKMKRIIFNDDYVITNIDS